MEPTPPTLPYWPYCVECEQPMVFDHDQPFAHCKCSTSEWGHPRPASYVMNPHQHHKCHAAMVAWNIALHGRVIDTVHFVPEMSQDDVLTMLIARDGYDSGITVTKAQ